MTNQMKSAITDAIKATWEHADEEMGLNVAKLRELQAEDKDWHAAAILINNALGHFHRLCTEREVEFGEKGGYNIETAPEVFDEITVKITTPEKLMVDDLSQILGDSIQQMLAKALHEGIRRIATGQNPIEALIAAAASAE